jgi:hypothetical protein
MKINKKIFAGMTVLALLFGLLLSGCITFGPPVTYVETETSQAIFAAISDLVSLTKSKNERWTSNGEPAHELGREITAGDLVSELGKRLPGLNLKMVSAGGIYCTYNGKEYMIDCSFVSTAAIGTVGKSSILEAIFSVKEKEEPAQSAE